jgi:hypothetical protein
MGTSWKTTVVGIVGGILNLIPFHNMSGKQIAMSVVMVVAGVLCKDFNVTGGTVSNNTFVK